MKKEGWYLQSYRRNLIDMHIDDWDKSFLSKLSPSEYVGMLKTANVQTAMVYANSHVGLCNWPTETGKMHAGLKGKDFFGEMVRLCHEENISIIAYFTLIYDNWAYDHDPSWRIIHDYGCGTREKSVNGLFDGARYGNCCPNSLGYREYVFKQLQELCTKYDVEGFFLDMTFWARVCYCPSCQARYKAETGKEIPEVIDWENQEWLTYQSKRAEWMTEFANFATNAIKILKPQVTVVHNFAGASANWRYGLTEEFMIANDYASGDFYGGLQEQSFICKLYHNLSKNEPFEYMTSRCYPNLKFHTSTKARELLELQNYITLAHNGAFQFIDAIDPDGTIHPTLYKTMGEIFSKSMKYEPYLGGLLCSDVCVYFSLTSKINPKYNGKLVHEDTGIKDFPHLNAALKATETLRKYNIPFDVVSRNKLKNLNKNQILILPDISLMDNEEAEIIRDFVSSGGSIFVSGYIKNQIMQELIGIEYLGMTKEQVTYIEPTSDGEKIFKYIERGSPLTINGSQCLVKTKNQDEIMATITLPYTDPNDFTIFASIHSNPPGKQTSYPSIILRDFGKGKVMWVATPIEVSEPAINKQVFIMMIKKLANKKFYFQSNAPAPIEILLFHQPENKRYIVNIINEQEQFPIVEAHEISISVDMSVYNSVEIQMLPEEKSIPMILENGMAKFTVPKLEIFQMLALYYY